MTTAVLVPHSETFDPDRQRAWDWIEACYRTLHPEWEIVTGICTGPWRKALAVTDALTRTDADVLIVADADVIVTQLDEYHARVADGTWEWAQPHRRIIRLNQPATARIIRDGLPTTMPPRTRLTQAVYDGMLGGGIVILTREMYERCPLDPRFEGWGGEDESWGRALMTLTQPGRRSRGNGVCWHLYHESQPRMSRRMGNEANGALAERYRLAAGDREKTEVLIEEGRRCLPTSSAAP